VLRRQAGACRIRRWRLLPDRLHRRWVGGQARLRGRVHRSGLLTEASEVSRRAIRTAHLRAHCAPPTAALSTRHSRPASSLATRVAWADAEVSSVSPRRPASTRTRHGGLRRDDHLVQPRSFRPRWDWWTSCTRFQVRGTLWPACLALASQLPWSTAHLEGLLVAPRDLLSRRWREPRSGGCS